MRTNKRRNLTSSQWATIAIEANEIINAIAEQTEKERRKKQAKTQSVDNKEQLSDNKLSDSQNNEKEHKNKKHTKVAEIFNTNRTYIDEATRLKRDNPEAFEDVKSGKKTIAKVKKERKTKF